MTRPFFACAIKITRYMELITQQLLLRPFQKADVKPLFNIQRDHGAMQFTFNVQHIEESESYLASHAEQKDIIGFAPWTVCLKEDKTVIGWGGLMEDPFDPGYGPEVAYFFSRNYWGKGLATELVKASINYGFEHLKLEVIGAFARPENLASIRVLEKCGFRYKSYNSIIERNYYQVTPDTVQPKFH